MSISQSGYESVMFWTFCGWVCHVMAKWKTVQSLIIRKNLSFFSQNAAVANSCDIFITKEKAIWCSFPLRKCYFQVLLIELLRECVPKNTEKVELCTQDRRERRRILEQRFKEGGMLL